MESMEKTELFTDENYFFFFQLEHQPVGADDYISGTSEKNPRGFRLFAWPCVFTSTGELAYYVDERERVAISSNHLALYDGLKSFPPDLRTPRAAVSRKKGEVSPWHVKPLKAVH